MRTRLFAALLPLALALPLAAKSPASTHHGLDLGAIDRKVVPGDDFYRYANGGWERATTIPSDQSRVSAFSLLADEAGRRTVALIEQSAKTKAAAGSDARKVGDVYAAYMDEAAIEKRGLEPVRPELKAIEEIGDRAALSRFLGAQLRNDVDPLNNAVFHTDRLFGLWVAPAFDDPSRYAAYLFQGGLGMEDRDDYLGTDPTTAKVQAAYREHIAAVLALAGFNDPTARAARIFELERKIAATHESRTDSEDVLKANNRWATADFATKAPGIEWSAFFGAAGLAGQPSLFVWQPATVTQMSSLVEREPLDVWKEYLAFHAVDRASTLLPKKFDDEHFRFYGTAITGAKVQRPREKRAVDETNAILGEAVGRLYVGKYFSPEAKSSAQKMVHDIIEAFRARIDRLEWMTPATRAKAKAKLDTLYVGIGYPDKWRDYSGLEIVRGDALGNRQRSELFDYHAAIAKLGKTVDRTEWSMTPQTVNAVNLPLQNALNFPAAILQAPFFDAKRDPIENYAAIGSVIGHEISHSFDDQGSQFDEHGKLANWWTPEDAEHFRAAAERLAAQYSAYEPLPGMHVNGKLTLSENIADVAGVSAAYDAYRLAYPNATTREGFTPDQRFFLAFAQIWRSKYRPEALRGSLMTNGHAPGEFRADVVRNLDAWYSAFDVKPGEKLYLAPAARVRVW